MRHTFEDLRVYRQAADLANRVCTLARSFPGNCRFLADQVSRAAVSIAAKIAEGTGRLTVPDRRNFYGISRGSLRQCVLLLEITFRQGLVEQAEHTALNALLWDISVMLNGLIFPRERSPSRAAPRPR